MPRRFELSHSLLAAALLALPIAVSAQAMSRPDHGSAKTRIGADYKADETSTRAATSPALLGASEARLRLPGRTFAEPAGSTCRDAQRRHEGRRTHTSAKGRNQPALPDQPQRIAPLARSPRS